MAARKSMGPSRRQAVIALGAGLIGGTIDLSGEQQAQVPPPKPSTKAKSTKAAPPAPFGGCAGKKTTEGYVDLAAKRQLQLASCCEYVKDVLNNGYPNGAPESKAALKRFMTLLAGEQALLDYCFIQFDVKADKIDQLKTTVTTYLRG